MALHLQPQAARATTTPQQATPDYVAIAQKADATVMTRVSQNPIFKCIFEGDIDKEERIAKVQAYLTAGLQDGTAKAEDLDKRRAELAELNASIQVIRRQLGAEQAKAITSKAYADFQRIVTETSADVSAFEGELAPLCELAELFSKYGADGNIIEKINLARQQKQLRERRLTDWTHEHEMEVLQYRRSVNQISDQIKLDKATLETKWIGKSALEAKIANAERDLEERRQQLAAAEAKKPDGLINGESDVDQVDEQILELQNIGGEKFKSAVTALRDHTEVALAKISTNFDEAVAGLTNARESFIAMDRNCGDASFALSVLEVGVRAAEATSREIAQGLISQTGTSTGAMAELDRMEREQRSEQILAYTSALTTFLTDMQIAVSSLRSGRAVIQTILRMNQTALEQANTHKITGIANTADAVTITIGSIIEVCNRAASRTLADGLTMIRARAQEGSARLIGGTYESIAQQNAQMQEFKDTVEELKNTTTSITANTVELLKQQFDIVAQMAKASGELEAATTDAQRTTFAARAGVGHEERKPDAEPPASPFASLRMPGH